MRGQFVFSIDDKYGKVDCSCPDVLDTIVRNGKRTNMYIVKQLLESAQKQQLELISEIERLQQENQDLKKTLGCVDGLEE